MSLALSAVVAAPMVGLADEQGGMHAARNSLGGFIIPLHPVNLNNKVDKLSEITDLRVADYAGQAILLKLYGGQFDSDADYFRAVQQTASQANSYVVQPGGTIWVHCSVIESLIKRTPDKMGKYFPHTAYVASLDADSRVEGLPKTYAVA